MRDKWTEISSEADDHTTFMMPVPGGALIRHVEKSEDGDIAVSICFVPNADGKTAFSPVNSRTADRRRSAFTFGMRAGLFVFLLLTIVTLTGCPGPNYAPYNNMKNSYG